MPVALSQLSEAQRLHAKQKLPKLPDAGYKRSLMSTLSSSWKAMVVKLSTLRQDSISTRIPLRRSPWTHLKFHLSLWEPLTLSWIRPTLRRVWPRRTSKSYLFLSLWSWLIWLSTMRASGPWMSSPWTLHWKRSQLSMVEPTAVSMTLSWHQLLTATLIRQQLSWRSFLKSWASLPHRALSSEDPRSKCKVDPSLGTSPRRLSKLASVGGRTLTITVM